MTKYLRNIWYMAAWANELRSDEIIARTYLDTPVALFRDATGRPAAILDRCPHRFAPISVGSIKNGCVSCRYHGLGFDRNGACVSNPHGPVLHQVNIPSYPTFEAHRAIWIWLGDANHADPSAIPDLSYLSDAPDSAFSCGKMMSFGNYELFVDNLMDLSHTDFLHPDTLGGAQITQTKAEIKETDEYVDVTWFSPNTKPHPLLQKLFSDLPPVTDFWQRVRWYPPAVIRLTAATVAAGKGEDEALINLNAHVATPETATTTHYFYAATRNYSQEDADLNARIAEVRERIFTTEDKPMIQLVQRRMGEEDFWSLKPVLMQIDKAPVCVRRKLAKLIADETAETHP